MRISSSDVGMTEDFELKWTSFPYLEGKKTERLKGAKNEVTARVQQPVTKILVFIKSSGDKSFKTIYKISL